MALEVKKSESFTITNPRDSSIFLSLSRAEAQSIYEQLGKALGVNEIVGTMIARNAAEPDLPVGTRVQDNTGDIGIKTQFGWKWEYIGGELMTASEPVDWSTFQHNYSFVVIN